uniref:hypothetical protein n=1 Tax=Pedobacter schmidteae TaxID=2201271 RepID=UPI000EB51430|nr:hypothetical protein [Pedobacter schmidteae]
MKLKLAGLFGLIVAVACVFAFNANAFKRANSSWKIETGLDQFVPTNYTSGTAVNCPSDGKVCYIVVPETDLYTAAEVASLGLPVSYIGKPKVDDFNTGGLGAQIQAALLAAGEVATPVNGRTIIERN